ncbi:MAG: ABC transporter ATP-binding protein [Chloroflexi bacterium]|nr:ABC transporter ATP-binding protein [Chloroflexota bacterium]
MNSLLELQNVTKIYGGGLFSRSRTLALDNVSFAIPSESPQITAIAGESGSGKTTMARVLLGVVAPTEGKVLFKGQDVAGMTRKQRREFRREVQPVFQDPFEVYNPFYKVDHVLTTPIKKFRMAGTKREAQRIIEDALELVGLRPDETLGRFPHQLSGGQRQRVMVARALLLKPSVILADEPVSMVDASLRATILDSIRNLNRELGIAILYITHDLTTAYQISDNIMVLYRGSVVEAGSVERVIKHPQHPYTRLLVESIPQPDPDKRWGAETTVSNTIGIAPGATTCKFVDRCLAAMPMCAEAVPGFYRIDPDRGALCFLYADSPELTSTEIATVLQRDADSHEPVATGAE